MSVTESPGAAACPGCVVGGEAARRAAEAARDGDRDVLLSLPTMHCAGCISSVESGLMAMPDVRDARVNLSQKRARVTVGPQVEISDLVEQMESIGFEAHALDGDVLTASDADKAARALLVRLGVAGFAMMNVMLLSIAVWSGAADATRDLFHWISSMIALPTVAYAAQPFFIHAWSALRHGRLNMDVPISLAILLASGMSLYETAQGGEHAYFDAALSLTFFLLAGRYLDKRTRSVARSAAAELAALEVPKALRLTDGGEEWVKTKDVAVGDHLRVLPGSRVPVDGVITDGSSEIDRSLITGETDPVLVQPGTDIRAGEVNLTGPFTLRATAVGEDTLLRSLADLVAIAEESKSKYNALADRAAKIYAPAVHLLALFAFIGWITATGDWRVAMNVAVATLIITCPCALGLAVPAVSTVASGVLYQAGLLVKHATALERLAEVTEVVIDKTGTLTQGTPTLTDWGGASSTDRQVALALAAGSSHPLAQALAKAARGDGVVPAELTDLREVPGFGIEGDWAGQRVRLGRAAWVGAPQAPDLATHLSIGGAAPISVHFRDTLRLGAADLIADLKARGLPVTLLSGDHTAAVSKLADILGLTDWQAEVTPDDKADFVRARMAAGEKVLMMGDGLNDTASLALAHVSLAPASALEATRVASDVVLVRNDLREVGTALTIAAKARRRILENFGLAATYNAISIPIAVSGFATPLAAALAMSASSIMVSVNALRTR